MRVREPLTDEREWSSEHNRCCVPSHSQPPDMKKREMCVAVDEKRLSNKNKKKVRIDVEL